MFGRSKTRVNVAMYHCREPPRTAVPSAALESLARCVNGQFGLRYFSSRLMMQKNFSISLSPPSPSPSPPAWPGRPLPSISLPIHDFRLAADAILSVALGNPTPTPHFTSTRAQKDRREEQKLLRLPNSASVHHLPFSLPVEIVSVVNRMDVGDV